MRGNVNIRRELEYVFKLMHLPRTNHVTLMKESPTHLGSIQRVKDYATWGEVTQETVYQLLCKRGFLTGNRKLTDELVKTRLSYESIEELAKAIFELKVDLWKINDLKPVFRLHPPRGGFKKTVKKPYPNGEVGYRGDKINDLILKMI